MSTGTEEVKHRLDAAPTMVTEAPSNCIYDDWTYLGRTACNLTAENVDTQFKVPYSELKINVSLMSNETLDALIKKINALKFESDFKIILTSALPIEKADQNALKIKLEIFKKLQKTKMQVSLVIPSIEGWDDSKCTTEKKYALEDLYALLDVAKEIPQISGLDFSFSELNKLDKNVQLDIVRKISGFPTLSNLKFWNVYLKGVDYSVGGLNQEQLLEVYTTLIKIPTLRNFGINKTFLYGLRPADILSISEFVYNKTQLVDFDFRAIYSNHFALRFFSLWTLQEKRDVARAELMAACNLNAYSVDRQKIFSEVIANSDIDLLAVVSEFLEKNPKSFNLLPRWLNANINLFLQRLSESKVKELANLYLNASPDAPSEKLEALIKLCAMYPGLRENIFEFLEIYPEHAYLLGRPMLKKVLIEYAQREQDRVEKIAVEFLKKSPDNIYKILNLRDVYPNFFLKVVEAFLEKNPEKLTCLKAWLNSFQQHEFSEDLKALKEETVIRAACKLLAEFPKKLMEVINLCDKYPSLRDVVLGFVEAHPEQLGLLNTSVFTTPLKTDSELRMREQNRVEKIAIVRLKTSPKTCVEVLWLCEFYPNIKALKFLYEELPRLEKFYIDYQNLHHEYNFQLTDYRESAEATEKLNGLLQNKKTTFQSFNLMVTIDVQSEEALLSIARLVNSLCNTQQPLSLIITVPNPYRDADKLFYLMSVVHKSIPCTLNLTSTTADNVLGKMASAHFLDFIKSVAADKRIVRLCLDNNQLSNFGTEVLGQGLSNLVESSSLKVLTVRNNGLVKLGFGFINKLLENFGDKIDFKMGISDASIDFATILNEWTPSCKTQFFKTHLRTHLERDENNCSHGISFINSVTIFEFKNGFSDAETKNIIMGCFDEVPEALPKLCDLVTHNPCLRDLDPTWIKSAASKFLKCFDYNNAHQIETLRSLFPCLKQDNAELNDLLQVIKNRPYQAWYEEIKLSLISVSEDNIQEAISLLNSILISIKCPKGIIELDKQKDRELELLALVINQLKFSSGATLKIVEKQKPTHGMARTAAFFKLLNNASISSYGFSYNDLTLSDEKSFFEILETLSNTQCEHIDLSNNKLNIFAKENLFEALKLLAACKAKEVDLSNNGFCSFGLSFVLDLKRAFQNGPFVRLFSLSSASNLPLGEAVEIMTLANSLEPTQKREFAEIYYRSALRARSHGFGDTVDACNFGLPDEQMLPILEKIASENAILLRGDNFQNFGSSANKMLNLCADVKTRFLLIKKMITLDPKSAWYILRQPLKLESIHNLELFLYAGQYEHEIFSELDEFNLFTSQDSTIQIHPAIEVLKAWQKVFLAEQAETPKKAEYEDDESAVAVNTAPMQQNYIPQEEDVEVIAEKVRAGTLPTLKQLCETHFAESAIEQKHLSESNVRKTLFIQSAIESLLNYKKDEEGSLPLLNMAMWFSWACAKILMEPKLKELCYESPDNKKPDNKTAVSKKRGDKKLDVIRTFNHVLKEILNFASPKLRYTLSAFFFDHVCADDKKRYFSLAEGCPLDALLPTLALCKILSQEQNAVEQEKCVAEIKALLEEVSFSTYYGRHFRSLVSAILAMSEDTTTDPLFRLQLINKILIKSIDKESKMHLEKFSQVLNYFKLGKEDAETLKKLETKKQTLERKIGKLKHTNINDPEIGELQTELAAVNAEVKGIYDKANANFKQTEVDELWGDLKSEFESEVLGNVRAYLPKGRLSNQDFNAFQRRVEGDLKLFFNSPAQKAQDFNQRIAHLIMLQGLAMLNKLASFRGLEQHNFTLQARAVLKELFDLSNAEVVLYDATFSKCHNEASLLTYLSKIRMVKEEGADKLMYLFNDFVRQALSNNSSEFYGQRYNRSDNRHLTTVFSDRATLKADWVQGQSYDLVTFVKDQGLTFKPYKPNFREFLTKKIFGHQHLDSSFYGLLKEYLNASDDIGRQKAREAAQKLMSQAERTNTNTTAAQAKKQHAIVQYECIQLLEASKVESESYAEPLKILSQIRRALSSSHNTANQFKHDIDGLIKGLKSGRRTPGVQDWTGWRIVDTDHFWSLFMAGTDVEGSCQAVDGNPSLNKCLMAYVMDGKNRILAIKNAEGVTVARCMLRLLWDTQNNSPVLFLEETYPETIRRDLYDVLVQFAIIRAQKLNATLVTLESTDASYQYEGEITALGNTFIPWEYVDALYLQKEYGEFTIPNAQVLYRAELKNDLAFQENNLETKQDFVFHVAPVETKQDGFSSRIANLQEALPRENLRQMATPLTPENSDSSPRQITPMLHAAMDSSDAHDAAGAIKLTSQAEIRENAKKLGIPLRFEVPAGVVSRNTPPA
jgi:hypothetical protein